MHFDKRRQRENETIDKFRDDLEMLRRRTQTDESSSRMNLAEASKFLDGVNNGELRTMLATHYTPLSTNVPTSDELLLKSKYFLLLKPPMRSRYYKNNYGKFNIGPATKVITGKGPWMTWTRDALVQTAVPQTIICAISIAHLLLRKLRYCNAIIFLSLCSF